MRVRGADLLTDVFGRWPSFHDAEVVRMALDRGDGERGPSLSADVHAFEITGEVDAAGYFATRHHVLVTFRFDDVRELRLEGFNHQNVLFGLKVEDVRARQLEGLPWEVRFDGTFGVEASFLCGDVAVESVRPWESDAP